MFRQGRARRRKGVILIVFTMMMLFVIVPAVGLAIDSSVMFVIKDKMQTAADGAAIAAGRSLSRGTDFTSQQSAATATAIKLYHMNMENGWLGNQSSADPTVTFPTGDPLTMNVRVDAVASVPTYFMRILGPSNISVRTSGQTTRRFVNIMMVLDRSGSIQSSGSCPQLRAAATQFAQTFVNGRDSVGLETFGSSYRTDFAIGNNFLSAATNIPGLVANLTCVGGTNSAAAYWQAYQQLVALNQPGALNAILFFTDGQPNTLHMPNLEINPSISSCTNKTAGRNGVIAATSSGTHPAGIFVGAQTLPPGASISPDMTVITNSAGCHFASSNLPDQDLMALTRAGAAEVDVFGTLITGWKPVTRDSSGRITVTNANLTNAGINALVNAAANARANTALNVVTYSIGLGADVDSEVLNRVANVAGSTYFDNTQPAGMYVFAADGTQLQSAFSQLASQALRISQ